MDKLVLNSKLPEELVDLVLSLNRDRDMKSPTSALIKDSLVQLSRGRNAFRIVCKRRNDEGWNVCPWYITLGERDEEYWNNACFLPGKHDFHWWALYELGGSEDD